MSYSAYARESSDKWLDLFSFIEGCNVLIPKLTVLAPPFGLYGTGFSFVLDWVCATLEVHMRRSPGVTFSAVLLLIGAVLLLWSGMQTTVALLSNSGAIQITPAARNSLTMSAALLLVLALWCGATAIGLSILAGWARRSMLAISLLLAVGSLSTAAMLAFYLRPGNPVSAAIAVGPIAQRGLVFFYAVFAALGAWWVYFFSTRRIKAQFEKRAAAS